MNKQIIILIIIGSGLAVFCQDISSYLTDKRFIDRELHCLLKTGVCDRFGIQIKRKDHIQIFFSFLCLY